jgi:ankyrin repeat protein
MEEHFKFDLLPVDIKTQVFSFIRFADWVLILSKVCSEWSHLCKTTTLPKVLDVRELLSHLCHDFNKARIAFSKCLKLGQQYNIHGLAADALFDQYKHAKIISKALPKLSWLQFLPPNTFSQRVVGEVPLVNSITHLDSAMIANAMLFEEIPICFPSLQALNFSTGVTLKTLQTMPHKFEKLKILRTGITLEERKEKKKRQIKRRRTAGETVGQLIEFVEAFKKVAPSLTELYMFWRYKRNSKPADLKREFEAVEEAAASKGIKLYCRDLVRIMKTHFVADPKAEFFMACYKHNNLPYNAYTCNGFTLLQHAIASLNIPVVRALFEHKLTNMEYELSARNEFARVGPQPPCLTDSSEPHPFPISYLIPYAYSPKCTEMVEILVENGFDLSKIVRTGSQQKVISAPIWSKLLFSAPTVRTIFEKYTQPIKWFDKSNDGQTLAHRMVIARGTTVFLDLMEKQLTKQEISDLMAVQDNKGNTPVHYFSDSSVAIIDRLIPYVKHCWNIKNKKDRTPFGQYLHRCRDTQITVKEPKLRRFILESPKIEDNDVFELYRTCGGAELVLALPLLAQKGANFSAKGKEGVGLLFIDHRIDLYEEFKKQGVDLKICDENGNNLLHGIFMENADTPDHKELIEYLVKEGVNINQINKNGVTPLIKAIQKHPNFNDVLETMLKNGADPNLHGPNSFSPLIAVLKSNNPVRKYIQSIRAAPLTKKDKSALMKLLEYGAKATSIKTATHFLSPLALTVTNLASTKLIRKLIQHGADIKERDDAGNSMLHMTSDISLKDVLFTKYEKVVDFLLNYMDINDRNAFGQTVLHRSVTSQPRLDYLISKGADINARDSLGNTPLFLVDDAGLDWADNLLTSPQLDLFAVNNESKTALHILVKDYELRLKTFMEKFNSMSVDQQNAIKKIFATNDGFHATALHEAITNHQFESVKICVEVFGISPAMKHNMSIMHLIDSPGTVDLAPVEKLFNYLLEHGADINAQNQEGDTPLHCAVQNPDNPYWIKFMLDRGSDPKIKNKSGKSVYDYMPNLNKICTGAMCFAAEVPFSAEELAEEEKEIKEEEEISVEDEHEHGIEEEEDMFNSDDMDDNEAMDANQFPMEEDIMMELENFHPHHMMNPEDDDDQDEDDDDEDMHNNNNDNDNDDDDEDDRPRRGRGGFGFGNRSFVFNL